MRILLPMTLMCVLACAGARTDAQQAAGPPAARVTLPDGTAIRVEIADTEPRRQRGLMFRQTLAPDEGMLFVFDEPGYYPFWMQNCLISIDILWLDDSGRITSIAYAVPPCRLPGCPPPCGSDRCPTYAPDPGTTAKYVLEVVSGFAKTHGLQVGDRIEVPRT